MSPREWEVSGIYWSFISYFELILCFAVNIGADLLVLMAAPISLALMG